MLLLLSVSLFAIILAADVVNYTYDDAGRLIKVDYGNGKAITYAYDKAGNPLKREVTAGASTSTAVRKREQLSPLLR